MEDIRWYYSLNKDNYSLMNREHLEDKSIIVCSETEYREYTLFKSYFDFYNYAKSIGFENNCLFEVIRGNLPQKPYFDIDISLKDDDLTKDEKIKISNEIIPLLISIITTKFPLIKEEDFMIFNSHGPEKRSFHIVIDKWCVSNYKQNRLFYDEIVKEIPYSWKRFLDKMYKNIQQFRVLYSHKWETSRIKIIDPICKWKCNNVHSKEQEMLIIFISSLISNVECCSYLPFFIEYKEESYEFIDVDIDNLLKIVNTIRDIKCFNIGKISDSTVGLNRISPSFCDICNRIHEHMGAFVFVNNKTKDVCFNCARNEKSKIIGSLIIEEIVIQEEIIIFVDIDKINAIRNKKNKQLKNKEIFSILENK